MEQRGRFRQRINHQAGLDIGPAAAAHPTQPATHHPVHHPKTKRSGLFLGRKWLLGAIVLLVILLGFLTYEYIHTKNQLEAAKNPTTAGKTEIQKIQNQLKNTVALPTETPTLATVSDVDKLRAQVFFKDAENGDKVLIYQKAGTAILYRPSTKKVIEFAPVNTASTGTQ